MANQLLESLGMLNNYLSGEVNRVRDERKKALNDTVAAGIAETFLQLPNTASEQDIRANVTANIKKAALTQTLERNMPLIESMYRDRISSMERIKKDAQSEALYQALSKQSGLDADSAIGGEGMHALISTQLQMTKSDKYTDIEGRAIGRSLKFKNGSWVPSGEEYIADATTTASKVQSELDLYAQKQAIEHRYNMSEIGYRASVDENTKEPEPLAGKYTIYNKQAYYGTHNGVLGQQELSIDPLTKQQIFQPYGGELHNWTDPTLTSQRQNKQTYYEYEAAAQATDAYADAILNRLTSAGLLNQGDLQNLLNNQNIKYPRVKLSAALEMIDDEALQNKFKDPEQLKAIKQQISRFREDNKVVEQRLSKIMNGNAVTINEDGRTPDEIEKVSAFKQYGVTQEDYNWAYDMLQKSMDNPNDKIGKALRLEVANIESYKERSKNKPVTFESYNTYAKWDTKALLVDKLLRYVGKRK